MTFVKHFVVSVFDASVVCTDKVASRQTKTNKMAQKVLRNLLARTCACHKHGVGIAGIDV